MPAYQWLALLAIALGIAAVFVDKRRVSTRQSFYDIRAQLNAHSSKLVRVLNLLCLICGVGSLIASIFTNLL